MPNSFFFKHLHVGVIDIKRTIHIYPFLLDYSICWHIIIYSNYLMIFCNNYNFSSLVPNFESSLFFPQLTKMKVHSDKVQLIFSHIQKTLPCCFLPLTFCVVDVTICILRHH